MEYRVNQISSSGGRSFGDDRYHRLGIIYKRPAPKDKPTKRFTDFEELLAYCLKELGIDDPRPPKTFDPEVGAHLDIKC